ncbi:MAG: hypothetical protein H5T86_14835, partial [Armatimonadetes bacterium]|nr:hypothetical protein [Armatimonadota bacterium]
GNVYATQRLQRLFFGVHFPTRLRQSQLALLPVKFARFQVQRPDGQLRDAAVTVSELFPEAMRATSKPLSRTVPPGARDGETCQFNRVLYIFVAEADGTYLRLKGRIFYPSRLLSKDGHDYSGLAASLGRMLARFEVYLDCLAPRPAEKTISVWLCEGGPAGAEEQGGDIYIYRTTSLRPGSEWVRELAHEVGHATLPEMAGWTEPEDSLAGDIGERWLIAALCREAEAATGASWGEGRAEEWVSGLWGPGRLDFGMYVQEEIAGAVRAWFSTGPYPQPGTEQSQVRRAAIGLVLWANAAHGVSCMSELLGPQGVLPSIVARYINWASAQPRKIELAARAFWGAAEAPPPGWLPFGTPPVALAPGNPIAARVYLPAGTWRACDEKGNALLLRWTPTGRETPAADLGSSVTSNGAWGVLEIGSHGQVAPRQIILTAGGEA